jgi:hypothetical protein
VETTKFISIDFFGRCGEASCAVQPKCYANDDYMQVVSVCKKSAVVYLSLEYCNEKDKPLLSIGWQQNIKGCSFAFFRNSVYGALVIGNHFFAKRQSNSRSAVFRAVVQALENVKDLLPISLIKADGFVGSTLVFSPT